MISTDTIFFSQYGIMKAAIVSLIAFQLIGQCFSLLRSHLIQQAQFAQDTNSRGRGFTALGVIRLEGISITALRMTQLVKPG
jgi:hypothetical protein